MDCCSSTKSYPPGAEKRLWCSHVSNNIRTTATAMSGSLSPLQAHNVDNCSPSCLPLLLGDLGGGVWLLAKEDGVKQHRLIPLCAVDACGGRQGPSSTSATEEPDPPHLPSPSPSSPLSPSLFCFRLLYDIPSGPSVSTLLFSLSLTPFSSFLLYNALFFRS